MPTITVAVGPDPAAQVKLSTSQTGNGDSTNILDRKGLQRSALLRITTVVGATPTITVNIQGSMDGVNWFNIGYALPATPETVAVAAIVIISAVTNHYLLRIDHPWRFLKLVYSANTNVTVTADVWA